MAKIVIAADDYAAQLELVCTAAEAGQLLDVGQERVNQFCIEGRLAAKRPGRDWIIARKSAEALAAVPRPAGGDWRKKRAAGACRKRRGRKNR